MAESPLRPVDDSVTRLRLVLLLTGGFLVVEFIGGLLSNSLALLSDAGHMFSDVAALTLALIAMKQMRRPPDDRRSYGYWRLEIVSALANGALLFAVAAVIGIEGYRRLVQPPEIRSGLMLGVGIVGLGVNVTGIILLRHASRESLGVRGAFLHILGDALGSVGAITAAIVIGLTGWTRVDALASFVIGLLILLSGAHLIRESLHILLEGVPRHISLEDVERDLRTLEGVQGIHDLHVWRIGGNFDTLTVHLVVSDRKDWENAKDAARRLLSGKFGIDHCTIEVEGPGEHERTHCPGVRRDWRDR